VASWCALVGLGFLLLALPATRTVLGGAAGPGLVPVLQQTGLAELLWAALVAAALVVCG
jgi:1,4-dihydroxy-2-naphthoate octaprenyltransferase